VGLGMLYEVIDYLSINSLKTGSFPIFNTALALWCLIVLPGSVLWQSKKNLKENKWINQTLDYQFDNDKINVTGESFNLSMNWTDLRSIKELKEWFLLYTGKRQALFIPKNRFSSLEEEKAFKQFVSTIKGVKLKLK
jgi:hypothetical protein